MTIRLKLSLGMTLLILVSLLGANLTQAGQTTNATVPAQSNSTNTILPWTGGYVQQVNYPRASEALTHC